MEALFRTLHFTVILAGLKKIVLNTKDFIISRFVKWKFHCICINFSRDPFSL